jgi:hypothetical protein
MNPICFQVLRSVIAVLNMRMERNPDAPELEVVICVQGIVEGQVIVDHITHVPPIVGQYNSSAAASIGRALGNETESIENISSDGDYMDAQE